MNTEFEEAMKRAQQARDIEMKKVQKVLQALPAGAIRKFFMELTGPPLDTVAKEAGVPEQDIIEMIEHKRLIPPKVEELLARHYGWSAKASLERRRKIAEFRRVMEAERQRREDEEKELQKQKLSAGELVKDLIRRDGLTIDRVARETGMPVQHIIEITKGECITPEIALCFERCFGWSATELLDHQIRDLIPALKAIQDRLKNSIALSKLCLEHLKLQDRVDKILRAVSEL